MKKQILFLILFTGFIFYFSSCSKKDSIDKGDVLLYTNAQMMNCLYDIEISVDNRVVGHIDASSIVSNDDCECDEPMKNGLVLSLEKGIHLYEAVNLNCNATNTTNKWTGQFEVKETGCCSVFLDVIKE